MLPPYSAALSPATIALLYQIEPLTHFCNAYKPLRIDEIDTCMHMRYVAMLVCMSV